MITLKNPRFLGYQHKIVIIDEKRVAKYYKIESWHHLKEESRIQKALADLRHPEINVAQTFGVERIVLEGKEYAAHIMELLPYPTIYSIREQRPRKFEELLKKYHEIIKLTQTFGFEPNDCHSDNCLFTNDEKLFLIDFYAWRYPVTAQQQSD